MPFEAVLAILIVFVAFPSVVFRGIARLRRDKAPARSGLRASDLRAIVHESVEAATQPLHDRIDTLEGLLLGDPEAGGRIDAALLDIGGDEPRRASRVPAS